MSAISAVFTNTKRIASRKAYQVILEVPEEHQSEVHKILGWPKSDGSVWVGVALLAEEPKKSPFLHDVPDPE